MRTPNQGKREAGPGIGDNWPIPACVPRRFVMQSVVDDAVLFRVHVPTTRALLLDVFANAVSPEHYLTGQPIKFKSICKFKVYPRAEI